MPTYYLTPAGAEGLRRYRYVGADHSLLYKYVLSPWAEWVLRHLVPLGAAPNTITLVGLVAQVAAFAVLVWHCPTMTELPPAWTGALAGAALFAYTTLDNVDGKQARRVGASSPLGLLFDHGCDALNSGYFGPVIMMMVMGSSAAGWRHLLSWVLATVPFFFTTWEEYWTHEFHLPLVNGPNEGLAILATGYAVTAWLGPAWWRAPASHPALLAYGRAFEPLFAGVRWCAGEPALAPGQAPDNLELLLAVPIVGIVLMAAANVATVTAHIRRAGGGWATVGAAYAQTLPYVALLLVAGWWLHTPVTKAAITAHPFMFYAALGGAFADVTSKLQMAHVCDVHYAPRWAAVAALAAPPALAALQSPHLAAAVAGVGSDGVRAVLAAGLGVATEILPPAASAVEPLLWATATLLVTSVIHYSVVAAREVADALDIDVFDISRQVARTKAAQLAAAKPTAAVAAPQAAAEASPARGSSSRRAPSTSARKRSASSARK